MSFDFDIPASSVARRSNHSILQPDRLVLGSCNGLICIAEKSCNTVNIWNPVTGFLQHLPALDISLYNTVQLYHRFGYGTAANDYKVLLGGYSDPKYDYDHPFALANLEMRIFSVRNQIRKKIEAGPLMRSRVRPPGALLNEALHFMHDNVRGPGIVAFDLGKEEFRIIPFPDFEIDSDEDSDLELEVDGSILRIYDLCVCECYLYILRWEDACEPLGWWVMKEYGVAGSWTKLFNLKLSPLPEWIVVLMPLVVRESGTVLAKLTYEGKSEVVRIEHGQEKSIIEMHDLSFYFDLIVYEETLLQLDDKPGLE